jgi:hypothetical protein
MFRTDIDAGFPHAPYSPARGSVFPDALHVDGPNDPANGFSLWLEYVVDLHHGRDMFWLMWYDPKGCPVTPASAVISRESLRKLVCGFVVLIPPR